MYILIYAYLHVHIRDFWIHARLLIFILQNRVSQVSTNNLNGTNTRRHRHTYRQTETEIYTWTHEGIQGEIITRLGCAVIDTQIDTDRHRFAHGHMNEYRKRKLAHSQRCSEFKYIQYQQVWFLLIRTVTDTPTGRHRLAHRYTKENTKKWFILVHSHRSSA